MVCSQSLNELHSMDAIDRRILTALQDDTTISIGDLANKVGLSQTPCWKRVQKLEAAGVILKRVALIAPEKIGLGLTVFVQVETGDHSGPWLKTFAQTVSAMPEVMDLYRMAGEVDAGLCARGMVGGKAVSLAG